MQNRIHQILQQKAMMGAGIGDGVMVGGYRRRRTPRRRRVVRRRRAPRRYYGMGYDGGYDGGDDGGDDGGILVGGYRRRRHHRPSAWNMQVSNYIRSHPGATVAEAAHALGGRRRRRGGVMVGGARHPESQYISAAQLRKLEKAKKQAYRNLVCNDEVFRSAAKKGLSKAQYNRMLSECGLDPLQALRKGLDMELRDLASQGAVRYYQHRGLGSRNVPPISIPEEEYEGEYM